MKKEKSTLFFKIHRTEGVGVVPNRRDLIKYVEKSRLDGFPIFKIEYVPEVDVVSLIISSMIVNTKPGYTIKLKEIEIIQSLEDYIPTKSVFDDFLPVQPMDSPSGQLFYLDYVYEDLDPRLLLMTC